MIKVIYFTHKFLGLIFLCIVQYNLERYMTFKSVTYLSMVTAVSCRGDCPHLMLRLRLSSHEIIY